MLTKPELRPVVRSGLCALSLAMCVINLSAQSHTTPCGSEVFDHARPYSMSYGMLWDNVLEYENPTVPAELQHELNGDHVSIGVSFDERGRPSSCFDLSVREDPNQQAISLSPPVKAKATEALCSSIRTWKFRAFRYCGRAVPVRGPLVFIVLDQKFTLQRIGTGPVERRSKK